MDTMFKTAQAWLEAQGIEPPYTIQSKNNPKRMYKLWKDGAEAGDSTTMMRWFNISGKDGAVHILNISRSTVEEVTWGTKATEGITQLTKCMTGRIIKSFPDEAGNDRWCICASGGEDGSKATVVNGPLNC